MKSYKEFYQRKLPHFQPWNSTFFLTYRLYGSIPNSVIDELKKKYRSLKNKVSNGREAPTKPSNSKYFKLFDSALDGSLNEPYWLSNEQVAQTVYDSLKYQNGTQYNLWAFSIMPNHVHSLLTLTKESLSLDQVLQRHKRFTARESNKILGRTGNFGTTKHMTTWFAIRLSLKIF